MLRFTVNSEVGLKVLKQSQKLFMSSTHDIPSSLLCPTSLLKARHGVEITGLTEKHDLERKKYDVEKHFDEQLNPQLRNVMNSMKNTNAEVIETKSNAVSIPNLFKNEDDIDDFCEIFFHGQNREFTAEIVQKIVYVLRNYSADEDRARCILSGVYSGLCNSSGNHNFIAGNLSAAGFGKALSTVLSTQSDNTKTLRYVLDILNYECYLSNFLWNMCVQDLYDAIDSPDGYDGAIFDALLKVLQSEDDYYKVKAAAIAVNLMRKTKMAKQVMAEKGYCSVLSAMPDTHSMLNLKRRLCQE